MKKIYTFMVLFVVAVVTVRGDEKSIILKNQPLEKKQKLTDAQLFFAEKELARGKKALRTGLVMALSGVTIITIGKIGSAQGKGYYGKNGSLFSVMGLGLVGFGMPTLIGGTVTVRRWNTVIRGDGMFAFNPYSKDVALVYTIDIAKKK